MWTPPNSTRSPPPSGSPRVQDKSEGNGSRRPVGTPTSRGTLLNGGRGLTVETRVPRQVADQLHYHPGRLDGIGPGYYADGSRSISSTRPSTESGCGHDHFDRVATCSRPGQVADLRGGRPTLGTSHGAGVRRYMRLPARSGRSGRRVQPAGPVRPTSRACPAAADADADADSAYRLYRVGFLAPDLARPFLRPDARMLVLEARRSSPTASWRPVFGHDSRRIPHERRPEARVAGGGGGRVEGPGRTPGRSAPRHQGERAAARGSYLDCKVPLNIRDGNTAVLVVHGLDELTWVSENDPPGRLNRADESWTPTIKDPGWGLSAMLWRNATLTVAARSGEFYVGDVPGGDDPPPDFAVEDGATVRARLASWASISSSLLFGSGMTERPATYDVLEAIRADLPRQIRGLEVNDPVLTLYGDDWSLTLMCPWKIERAGRAGHLGVGVHRGRGVGARRAQSAVGVVHGRRPRRCSRSPAGSPSRCCRYRSRPLDWLAPAAT